MVDPHTGMYARFFSSIDEFNIVLDEFNRCVRNKVFEKTHYDTWKKLSSWGKLSKSNQILLEYDDKFDVISAIANLGYENIKFVINDNSFGSFLYQTFFKPYIEKERKGMYNYDGSVVGTLKTNAVSSDCTSVVGTLKADTVSSDCDLSATSAVSSTYSNATKVDGIYVQPITDCIDGVKIAGGTLSKAEIADLIRIDGSSCVTTHISDRVDNLEGKISSLEAKIENKNEAKNKIKMKKENETMKGLTFDFGPITSDAVRMSVYGIAVKNNAGTYVSYNSQTGEIMDVDILNFDGSQFMYKVPIGLNAIQQGDVIIHNRKPMIVDSVFDKDVSAVDVMGGERKVIMPTRSPFGFNFITKIVSVMDMVAPQAPSQDAPFGNMLPFLLMNNDNKQDNNGLDPMMLMFMLSGQNMGNMNMMLPFLLANPDDSNKNMGMMLAMMMSQANPTDANKGFFTPPITINKA